MSDKNEFEPGFSDNSPGNENNNEENNLPEGIDSIDEDGIIGDFSSEGDTNDESSSLEDENISNNDNSYSNFLGNDSEESEDDTYHENGNKENENEEEYPSWDDSFSSDFNDDSIYGDPDNVALNSEENVFGNESSLSSYAPGDPMLFEGSEYNDQEEKDKENGSNILFWTMVALGVISAILLATWGALWANTGEANPISAIQGSTSEEASSTEDKPYSPEQSIDEEGGESSDQDRISELESSLTAALDDAQSAHDENDQLKSAVDDKSGMHTMTTTKTKTVNNGNDATKTKTVTSNNTRTATKTVKTTDTKKVTRTSTVKMAPSTTTKTITRPSTVKVPGPERTKTKTVPSGRVTVTTTVVERWG